MLRKARLSTHVVGEAVPNVGVSIAVLVTRVRRFEGRGRGDGIHAQVTGQDLVEHGAALARLHVQNHFGVLVVVVHLRDGILKLVSVQRQTEGPVCWKSQNTGGAVI